MTYNHPEMHCRKGLSGQGVPPRLPEDVGDRGRCNKQLPGKHAVTTVGDPIALREEELAPLRLFVNFGEYTLRSIQASERCGSKLGSGGSESENTGVKLSLAFCCASNSRRLCMHCETGHGIVRSTRHGMGARRPWVKFMVRNAKQSGGLHSMRYMCSLHQIVNMRVTALLRSTIHSLCNTHSYRRTYPMLLSAHRAAVTVPYPNKVRHKESKE